MEGDAMGASGKDTVELSNRFNGNDAVNAANWMT